MTTIMYITLFLYEVRACTVKTLQLTNFPSQKLNMNKQSLNKGRTSDQQGETYIALSEQYNGNSPTTIINTWNGKLSCDCYND